VDPAPGRREDSGSKDANAQLPHPLVQAVLPAHQKPFPENVREIARMRMKPLFIIMTTTREF
jgi:hypothetical protein